MLYLLHLAKKGQTMISKELASAVLAEHIACFEDREVKWVNYPFTRTHELGVGYGGQANFYNVFALANDVKLWALTNGYIINLVNKSNYRYDDPYSYDDYTVDVAYAFTVTKLGSEQLPYTGETFSVKDRLSDYEVEIAAIMAAGNYVLEQVSNKKQFN